MAMIKLLSDTKAIYRDAGTFALAFPLLFLIPVVVEMAQHVVELQAGMYVDEAGAIVAEADPLRLQFGFVKTLALLLPSYWFARFVVLADRDRASRVEWPAFGLWLVVFGFEAVQMWWGLFGPALTDLAGLEGQAANYANGALMIGSVVLSLYLTAWTIAWALGNRSIGPVRSLAIMHQGIWHAAGLMLSGMLPLMVVHHGLAVLAVLVLPAHLDWAAMMVDSVVVGFLALTIVGASARAAIHATGRAGIGLVPALDGQTAVMPAAVAAQ